MTLIDTGAAAYMLRSSERRVRRLIQRGQLTNHGTPRRVLISVTELAALIETGAVKTSTR